jgi:serine/threonine-protein kinase
MSPERRTAETFLGTVLGDAYHIDALVGEGGMGTVFAASHLRLDKRVAVKVMARELAADAGAMARFHREAQVTSALGHPHIVQVFDFSTTPSGEPYLVMELLDGMDLEQRIHEHGPLSPQATNHIVKQVGSALAATHARGIIHRDLKPANVYLVEAAGETDFVKVLDFGMSKVRSATTKLTGAATLLGTPYYMSPEQALGRIDEVDERTDQWALACIAWECLAGTGPFAGENVPSLLFQVVHEPPTSLAAQVPGLRPEIEEVLRRALSKNKQDRFPSVAAFCQAFESALYGGPAASASAANLGLAETLRGTGPAAADPRVATAQLGTTFTRSAGELDGSLSRRPARSRWPWLAGVAGTVAVLVAGLLWLRPGGPSRAVPASPPVPAPAPSRPPPPPPAPAASVADLPEAAAAAAKPGADLPARGEDNPARHRKDVARRGERSKPARAPGARPKVERKLIEDL